MISIARPLLGHEEEAAVHRVLTSGQLAQGENVAAFERRFAEVCHVREAVALSSGTAALHLALLAHDIGPGDEVITTALTIEGFGKDCQSYTLPTLVGCKKRLFSLGEEAEWIETLEAGWDVLVGTRWQDVVKAVDRARPETPQHNPFGGGDAAILITHSWSDQNRVSS